MPIILVIIGVIAALGLGGYFWETSKHDDAVQAPVTAVVDSPVTVTPTEPTPTPTEPIPVTASAAPTSTATPPTTPVAAPTPAPVAAPKTAYKNAEYSVTVNYVAPDRNSHPVTVTLTLKNDIVTASDVTFGSEAMGATANYQSRFASEYKSQVIGKTLDSINLSRVGGASLTSNAWNNAKAEIAIKAKA